MRKYGLKISFSEWMTLMDGLSLGLANNSLMGFYQLCRCTCIKREDQLDLYDQCFAAFFENIPISIQPDLDINEELFDWLKEPISALELSEEEKAKFSKLDFEELRKKFEERLKEQKEKHDGGSKWIGTGGTSPFGHSGYHPSGVRVGGESRNRSAVQIASKRRFQNLRHDIILDTRQIGVALKKLRHLSDDNTRLELDLDETIKKTSSNCGDISIVFKGEKRNSIKLLLLMDVGGSMTMHTRTSERLFSAAFAAKHFRHFKFFYFHNCPYETLYEDMDLAKRVSTADLLSSLDKSWKVIFIGDAAMSPYELTTPGASVDWYHHNEESGVKWLQRFEEHFEKSIWLNPEPKKHWEIASNHIVRQIFKMYPLTIDGIEEGIDHLRK